jgi:hypothetical protein
LEAGANPYAKDKSGDMPVVHAMYAVGKVLSDESEEHDALTNLSLLQNPHCVFNYSLREAKLESAGVPFLAR